MTAPVLVTGATGNVGRTVVASLRAAGLPVRAAGRRPAAVADELGVAAARLDLTDRATFASALQGVGGLFLIRPPAIARVRDTLNALLDDAVAAGVGHVVFSSVAGADTNPVVPHHRVERHLRGLDVGWTILRPGFFAQNLGDAYRTDIVADDRLYLPAGDGRVAWIDVRDLGDVAAAAFADPGAHDGHGYTLTGPEAVPLHAVADLLSTELGRRIRYEPASAAGYVRHLRSRGLPLPRVLVQLVLHLGLRRGDAADVDPTLGRLLGRPARTVADYIADHRDLWAADADPAA